MTAQPHDWSRGGDVIHRWARLSAPANHPSVAHLLSVTPGEREGNRLVVHTMVTVLGETWPAHLVERGFNATRGGSWEFHFCEVLEPAARDT